MGEKKEKNEHEAVNNIRSFFNPDESKIDITTTKGFFQDLIVRMKDIDVSGMGAQLAYFFLLSFFPLLISIITLVPYLNINQEEVFNFLQTIVPAEVFLLTQGTLTELLTTQNGGGLLSIGILGTLWSASRGVNALTKTLNGAYETEPKSGLISRGLSLVFTIALVVVILIALAIPIFGYQFAYTLFNYLGVEETFANFWEMVRMFLPPVLIFIVLNLLYWVIPNTDPRLKLFSVLPGSIFSTVAWVILIYGFSFYVNNFGNYASTYGSIAGVIILMLWLYFTGMILIFGGLINASVHKRSLVKKGYKE
ncbi:YihY/virulence factor BrkB family protein [Lysinibacillus yapensis]|uniref:YihY/virulence factor BrkB family protein n=1 Tax=Ureibacillus yapensis TaxID=2304605 RepID=A0A396S540_9BACL|nr:YihY/virulence factor BrkB family protein [Lysinibacillus yapensis]